MPASQTITKEQFMTIENRKELLNVFDKIDNILEASKKEIQQAERTYPNLPSEQIQTKRLALIAQIQKNNNRCEELIDEADTWILLNAQSKNYNIDSTTCSKKKASLNIFKSHDFSSFNVKINTLLFGTVPALNNVKVQPTTVNKTPVPNNIDPTPAAIDPTPKRDLKIDQSIKQNIRTSKQSELLAKLKETLDQMRKEFPSPKLNEKGRTAEMGLFLAILSADLNGYINKRNHNNPDEKAQYEYFKGIIHYHLYEDSRGKAVRKPNSAFYHVHYWVASLFRGFFRLFDLLLSFKSGQTKNDTPGYKPFFKLPEASLRDRALELSKEFNNTINQLDELKGIKTSVTCSI